MIRKFMNIKYIMFYLIGITFIGVFIYSEITNQKGIFYMHFLFTIMLIVALLPQNNKEITKEMIEDLYQFKVKINDYKLFKDIYFFGDKYYFKSEKEVFDIIKFLNKEEFKLRTDYFKFYNFLRSIEKKRTKNEIEKKYNYLNS